MVEVEQVVAKYLGQEQATPRHIVLSGHSGGYRVISYILLQGGMEEAVKEVWLFDGLYGQLEKYAMWLERRKGRFVNIYTKDGGTFNESLDFKNSLKAWGLPLTALNEPVEEPTLLPTKGSLFWYTSLEHNEVIHIRRHFFQLARSSPYLE